VRAAQLPLTTRGLSVSNGGTVLRIAVRLAGPERQPNATEGVSMMPNSWWRGWLAWWRGRGRPWPQPTASYPWLDRPDAPEWIAHRQRAGDFDADTARKLYQWHRDGYLILPGVLDDRRIEALLAEFERLYAEKAIVGGHRQPLRRDAHGHFIAVINVHMQSDAVKEILLDPQVLRWGELLLGRPVYGCQTINFFTGSQRALHHDHVHMTTRPYGYFFAAWFALEDVHPDAGPLVYVPGSHRLPYIPVTELRAGKDPHEEIARLWQKRILRHRLETRQFLARKGDVLLWHANLAHGGAPVRNPALTRISIACHYAAFGVEYFHELSGDVRDPGDVLWYKGRPYLPEYYDANGTFAPTRKIWLARMARTERRTGS